MNSYIPRGALAAACLLVSLPALAHAVLDRTEASPDAPYRGAIRIGHGCKGLPTTSVSVTIPEGVIGVRPMAKPGWTISIARGAYARPYELYKASVAEGVKTITWSGASLPDEQFDEFVFSARFSDAFKPGETVPFPVEQVCETGRRGWVEVPAAGQDGRALASPAPMVRIVSAAGSSAPSGADTIKAGDLTISQPWIRATPGGAKVAAGYLKVANGGAAPDRLLATSIPLAGRGEVHEMSMEGGIMKMRQVAGGILIPPGQTVELKPGGLHLMFLDLRGPAKEGETVRGTLTFEKAGTVDVAFTVGGLGARAAPAVDHSRH